MHDRGSRRVRYELRGLHDRHHALRYDELAARVRMQDGRRHALSHHDDARDLLVLCKWDGLRSELGAVQSTSM